MCSPYRQLHHAVVQVRTRDLLQVARVLGVREYFPLQEPMSKLFGAACVTESLACVGTIASIAGCNPANIDPALYPLYMDYMPSGAAGCDFLMHEAFWDKCCSAASRSCASWLWQHCWVRPTTKIIFVALSRHQLG